MHCCLRQRHALLATIHSNLWESVDSTEQIQAEVVNIEDEEFWKALYLILQYVWPALRAPQLGDSNKPGIHIIYYLLHLTSVHINKSAAEFKNSSSALFLSEMDDVADDLLEGELSNEEE